MSGRRELGRDFLKKQKGKFREEREFSYLKAPPPWGGCQLFQFQLTGRGPGKDSGKGRNIVYFLRRIDVDRGGGSQTTGNTPAQPLVGKRICMERRSKLCHGGEDFGEEKQRGA